MTALVLLSRPAWARVVAADLFFNANGLLLFFYGCIGARLFGSTFCLLPSAFIDPLPSSYFQTAGVHALRRVCLTYLSLLFGWQRSFCEEGDNIFIHPHKHLLEEVEGFKFINEQRIFLFVHRVLYTLFQLVEFAQVFFPRVVDHGEHDIFFHIHHNVLALALVRFFQIGDHLQGLETVGKRHHNIFEPRALCFKNIFDHGECLRRNAVVTLPVSFVSHFIYFMRCSIGTFG